jgi:hypothetical protein
LHFGALHGSHWIPTFAGMTSTTSAFPAAADQSTRHPGIAQRYPGPSDFAFRCVARKSLVPGFRRDDEQDQSSLGEPLTNRVFVTRATMGIQLLDVGDCGQNQASTEARVNVPSQQCVLRDSRSRRRAMKHRAFALLVLAGFSGLGLGGCVVPPPRARVVAVAPARVWVPGHWHAGVWVRGHWRYR